MPPIRFRLNGVETSVEVEADRTLLDILRNEFGLTLWTVADKDIRTVEGLGSVERPHPLQRAFIAEQAMQCGYCISGILMSAAALLLQNPTPSGEQVKAALDRNLCRCGSHSRIVRAVLRAAGEMAG